MFCFKCGSHQADDTKFCGACGTRLAGVSSGQQSGAASPVVSLAGRGLANSAPASETRGADACLTVDEWAVTCTAPDSDGDVRFEAKACGEFHGPASAHLARLFWIAFDPSGSIPLLQGDNTLNQDIDDEDSVEIEAGGYGKLGEGVDPAGCQVRGQVVLYPGEKLAPWTIPLPEAGQAGGEGPAWPDMGAEIAGWRLTCSDSSDDSGSYTLCLVVRNFGAQALSAVTFRVRVTNRKGDVWSTDYLIAERLAAGEMRGVETSVYVSERVKTRKGAVIEAVGIACPQEVVFSLTPVAPTVAPTVQPPADDLDSSGVDEQSVTQDEADDERADESASSGPEHLDVEANSEHIMVIRNTLEASTSVGASAQREILERVLSIHRHDPRNKLQLDCEMLLDWSEAELGHRASARELRRAIRRIQAGEATVTDEQLLDAATRLCHLAANRFFGEALEDAQSEWEEVDTTTDWLYLDTDDPEDLLAVVRPCGPPARELQAAVEQALTAFLADSRFDNLFIQIADGEESVDFVKVPADAGLTLYVSPLYFDTVQKATVAALASDKAMFGGTQRFFDGESYLVDFGTDASAAALAVLRVFREVYGFQGRFALTTETRDTGFDPQAPIFRRAPKEAR